MNRRALGLGALNLAGLSRLSFGLPSGAVPQDLLQYLNNGFPSSLATGSGSSLVADYAGVLRKATSPTAAIEGGRLATTVADGAELGAEILSLAVRQFDSGWVVEGESTVSGGVGRVYSSTGALSQIYVNSVFTVGRRYVVSYTVLAKSGAALANSGSTVIWPTVVGENSIEFVANEIGLFFKRTGITDTTLDNISVREVIPKWYDTLVDGTPLQPSEMKRTKNGSVKRYIDYPTIQRNQAYALGFKAVAVASDGIQRWYTCTTAGTSAASAPTFGVSGTTADGTAVWTYGGYATLNHKRVLGEPTRTNKVTARKANPTDLTNMGISGGDGNTIKEVSDDPSALAAAGLSNICTSGKVYHFDNRTGAAVLYVNPPGSVGNLNAHTASVYSRGTGAVTLSYSVTGAGSVSLASAGYTRKSSTLTPTDTTQRIQLQVEPGGELWAILPELIEAPFLGSPVVPGPSETDALASYTRPPTVNSIASAGVLRGNDWGFRLRVNPKAAGQATVNLFGTRVDANNYTEVYMTATAIRFYKVVATAFAGPQVSYTHAAGVPFEVDVVQTSAGMESRTRALSGADWSAWSAWVLDDSATAKLDAQIGATFEIGSNGDGANQVAANLPEMIEPVWGADAKTKLEALA